METSRFRYSRVTRVAPVLVCVLSVGCHHQKTPSPPVTKASVCTGGPSDCGHPHNLEVDVKTGVEKGKLEICVCRGELVHWDENGTDNHTHQFKVEFNKGDGTPFLKDTFNNAEPEGTLRPDAPYGKKYDYKITVDGTGHDPRVVVGGGP